MESSDDTDIDLDSLQSDLGELEGQIEKQRHLQRLAPEMRAKYPLESTVELEVPPEAADYVRAVVPESASMTVEKRNQLLHDELLNLEVRTTRYVFPNGDVFEVGPTGVVLKHPTDEEVDTEDPQE
jgi:hypothetical protein